MSQVSLFTIQNELLSIFQELEENGGELTTELEEALSIHQGDLAVKLSGYRSYHACIEHDIALCEKEEARIRDIRKSKERVLERLKGAMLQAVLLFGNDTKTGGKVLELYGEGSIAKLSTRKSEQVKILDEAVLPVEFWTKPLPPEPKPDKVAIKAAIKEGAEVPGASVETVVHLTIK